MNNNRIEIDGAIARLLSKESSYEDMIALNEWLAEDEKNRSEFIALGRYWDKCENNPEKAARAFAKSKDAILSSDSSKAFGRSSFRPWAYALATVAAAAALFFAVGTGEKQVYNYTAGDSIAKYELPDGTDVTLNKGTSLSYSESRFRGERLAELNGEAFFDVTHDARHPFIVSAGDAEVKVLGTALDVKYVEGESVSASLLEGSIEFSAGNLTEILKPGEHLSLDFASGKVLRTDSGVERYISWKEGIYRYRSITLSALAEEISSNYGCTVLMDPQLKDILMSGAFQADQPLESVLRILQSCLNVNWVINDNTVYLSSK